MKTSRLMIIVFTLLSGLAAGQSWHTEVIDTGSNAGRRSSIAIDSNDNVHITYTNLAGELKYGLLEGSTWTFTLLEDNTALSYNAIAVSEIEYPDSIGFPQIAYYSSGLGFDYCDYFVFDGSSWVDTTIDTYYAGVDVSIALDGNDNPHVSYLCSSGYLYLRYAHFDGSTWAVSTVDDNPNVGHYSSIAVESSTGFPHISYYDDDNDDLKHARFNGSSWDIEVVDSNGSVGRHSSIAIDSNDYPSISYRDVTNQALKYARWNGYSWEISTVDADGEVGRGTSIEIDSSDNPHISYYSNSEDVLKYAFWTGSQWEIQTVDTLGISGISGLTSLALNSSDWPHITYYAGISEGLRYSYYGYLGIEEGESEESSIQHLSISPNPSPGFTNVAFTLTSGASVDIEIFDISGRIVYSETMECNAGFKCVRIDDLQMGVYLVRIKSESEMLTGQSLVL